MIGGCHQRGGLEVSWEQLSFRVRERILWDAKGALGLAVGRTRRGNSPGLAILGAGVREERFGPSF